MAGDLPSAGVDPRQLLPALVQAAQEAGERGLAFFEPDRPTRARVTLKTGGSPVTEADFAVDAALRALLAAVLPQAAYLSEETVDTWANSGERAVFVVDPIDGTRGFMRGDPRWCVSAALLIDRTPALGVLYLPATKRTYAASLGGGATLNGATLRVSARDDLSQARSSGPKSMTSALSRAGRILEEDRIPSVAIRFANVAAGDLDIGLASTDTHDWDIAAADLILREAGGSLCDLAGVPPTYLRAGLRHGALVAAPSALMPSVLDALSDRRVEPHGS
jgi:myo-inositol-1(or 4)-monophosphatase